MPINPLGQAISDAVADHRLDLRETRGVITKAGNTVSTPEAIRFGRLEDSIGSDGPDSIYATRGARSRLEQLFADANLPFGKNEAQIRASLTAHFDTINRGPEMTTAPRASSYLQVTLRDARMVDGTRETVFFTAATRKGYLRVDGGGRANPEPRWYGPFDLKAVVPAPVITTPLPGPADPSTDPAASDGLVSQQMHGRARALYFDLAFGEHHNWHSGAPPSDVRLHRDPHTVSSDIEAWFVTPAQPNGTPTDPDRASEVYFRGYGGQWSGPHAIRPIFA